MFTFFVSQVILNWFIRGCVRSACLFVWRFSLFLVLFIRFLLSLISYFFDTFLELLVGLVKFDLFSFQRWLALISCFQLRLRIIGIADYRLREIRSSSALGAAMLSSMATLAKFSSVLRARLLVFRGSLNGFIFESRWFLLDRLERHIKIASVLSMLVSVELGVFHGI